MSFVQLNSFTNYIDANIIMGRLKEEGINCWLKDENTVTINPLWNNAMGGIKLMVVKDQLERATDLLKQFYEEKKKKLACPYCNSSNIEMVSTPRKPGNWLSVLLGFFLTSYAMPVEQVYHCFSCTKEFEEAKETEEEIS
jgi:DNA-directed RNA polymerase subunit RPC12/RpoP